MAKKQSRSAKDPQRKPQPWHTLVPEDIPLWIVSFARHVLRACSEPGRYHITLDIPSKQREPREVRISKQLVLARALLDTRPRKVVDPPEIVHHLHLPDDNRPT